MLTLSMGEIWIFLIVLAIPGGIVGYVVAKYRQRAACGGKTPLELCEEMSRYKNQVTQHFQTTAGLLQQMTEQYRAVYEHMADGAQQFCDPNDATPQIASLRAGLLSDRVTSGAETASCARIEETDGEYRGPETGSAGESLDAPTADDGGDPVTDKAKESADGGDAVTDQAKESADRADA